MNETEQGREAGTFTFGEPEQDYPHRIGDPKCDQGWCKTGRFPCPCKCGGLIHANFGDDGAEDYWLYQKCDRCGDAYRFCGHTGPTK